MPTSAPAAEPRPLPGGLVLRTAVPEDLAQIGDLLVDRGEPGDRLDHRLVVADPDEGYRSCGVVADGDRVVSTLTLLDETVRVGEVVLPAGQVELVATATGYERRGLVTALMAWAHDQSARRGHLVQTIVGIPYFYRRFGYEYAMVQPKVRTLVSLPSGGRGDPVRVATPDDVAGLAALQAAAQAVADVAMPHPPARLRWLTRHETSRTWVVERDGRLVASARVPVGSGLVAEAAALDAAAAADLLPAVLAQAASGRLGVVERPGTVLHRVCEPLMGPAGTQAEAYYARLGDPAAVLEALRPVLSRRLRESGLARREVLLGTFAAQYRWPVTDDGLGQAVTGGPHPWPAGEGGAGVAPDALPSLLLGPHGIAGLARMRPDVILGPDAELFEALFPPQRTDALTYYLPF